MRIREARLDDIPALYDLFRRNEFLEEDLSLDQFTELTQWLFFQSPGGVHYQIVAEDLKGGLVAHYGMVPLPCYVQGERMMYGLGSNLLIDKDHRSGLLFFNLQREFLNNYSKKGIAFTFGLVTREKVLETHLRTGYKKSGILSVCARPLNLVSLGSFYVRSTFLNLILKPFFLFGNLFLRQAWSLRQKNLEISEITDFPEEVNSFLQRALASFSFYSFRDRAILNWRFFSIASRRYQVFIARQKGEIVGYVACRRMRMKSFSTLAVVDLMFLPQRNDVATALLASAHQLAVTENVDLMVSLVSPNPIYRKVFKRSLFIRTPETFTLAVNHPRGAVSSLTEETLDQGLVTWFDHDYV